MRKYDLSDLSRIVILSFLAILVVVALVFAVIAGITRKDLGYVITDKLITTDGYVLVVEHRIYNAISKDYSLDEFSIAVDNLDYYSFHIGDVVNLHNGAIVKAHE